MADNQRVVFAPPVQLDEFWKADLGNYQFEHLSKSNLALALTVPESDVSYAKITGRLWGTIYSILLFGMPRLKGGLEVVGTIYGNGVTVHRAVTPYRMYFCPRAMPVFLSRNTFERAKVVASGLRDIHADGTEFFRLRAGLLAWVFATRSEHGDARLHQFVRAIEAVVKPGQGKTRKEFVNRCALFCSNGDILDELFNLRSATEHMNYFSQIVTGDPTWDLEKRGWFRSFQAELLAQTVYTRILSNPALLGHFKTDDTIDTFWAMDDSARRELWGKTANLNQLAQTRFG
jgi:hypothetical protein